jgi:Na+-driven multidrug efflux pump
MKKCKLLIPAREHFEVDGPLYRELTGQGLSMGFMLAIVSTGTVILQYAINQLGYLIIAGHTAARKLNSFCTMPLTPLALATATFVSQNRGADQRDRILKVVRYAMILSLGWAIFITIVIAFAAPALITFISGSSESVVIENGARYLRWNTPFYSVLGILLVLRNVLQGLGKKVVPLVSSVIELVGKIAFVLLFIPILKYFGVIICEPVIWCLMCIQLVISYYRDPYIRGKEEKK